MKHKKRAVLFSIVLVLTSLLICIQSIFIYQSIKNTIVSEVGRNAKDTAGAIAVFMEKDIENYKTLLNADSTYNKDYYEKMLVVFQHLKASTGADFVFTEKYISDKEVAYILDGEIPGSENFSAIGSTDSMSEPELLAFKSGEITASDIIKDEAWGYYLTGFAPIKDHNGSVAGLVGVDYSLEHIHEIMKGIRIALIIESFITSIILSIFFYKLINDRYGAKSLDYLTSLYSRSYFDKAMAKQIKKARKDNKPLSLLMIDIDYFKEINDKYGHCFGDRALKIVSEIIEQSTRNIDTCARYGGDEFMIMLPEATKREAIMVSERILNAIRDQEVQSCGDAEEKLSLSIGIAEWESHMTASELTEAADKMLYISKNTGKNKYTV